MKSAAEFAWAYRFIGEKNTGRDGCVSFADALTAFVALEPAVDAGLVHAEGLHVEDGFGTGAGLAA